MKRNLLTLLILMSFCLTHMGLIAQTQTDTLVAENFDAVEEGLEAFTGAWSGGNFYTDLNGSVTTDEAFSGSSSMWLPGDAAWTGTWGDVVGIVDNATYTWSFKYKGTVVFELFIGRDLGYDLENDPDGIVPGDAIVLADGDIPNAKMQWTLSSEDWADFTYSWEQGSWLADNSLESPASVGFVYAGTSNEADNGYIDDLSVKQSGFNSTENLWLKNIKIYPNPFNSILNIKNTDGIKNVVIKNIIGQEIMKINVTSNNIELNLSELNQGLYIISIVNKNNNVFTRKIFKK